jgi:hypothetical protein
MAARPKLTPDVQRRICDAIGIGATYDLAAKYGGVAYETFRRWRESNRAFCAAIESAEARAAVGWLAKIEQAASDGTWQAAAWKLERRYPQLYGRTVQQVEATVTATLDATVTAREAVRAHLTEADIDRLSRALIGGAEAEEAAG